MSVYIEREADKYGFEYIEINNRPFDTVAEEVMRSLGLSVR
jgi:hypothetical protein